MNVVLLVVDSLRSVSLQLPSRGERPPRTPFLAQLIGSTTYFRRAYATECWTLPTHCSMFTGLLPSEHGAHFQTMAYTGAAPTIAELLARAGHHTELVTRNFVFDGTIPGVTRGFQKCTRVLSERDTGSPLALLLALAKPRFRRHLRRTGLFHPLHRESRAFLRTFARSLMPADREALTHVLEVMERCRRTQKPCFIFCNLYDVHAPYPPTPHSLLRSFASPEGCLENLMFAPVLSCLGAHRYLRPGFRLPQRARRMLLGRYHRAIELMDEKLDFFYRAARGAGLLEDTLLIVTSDHGEAFGEHGLYLHDASVYDVHLHVPLWIHHPAASIGVIDDVVSTRDLFGLMRTVGMGGGPGDTILDADYRARHPVARAEHFYYPHASGAAPQYRQNLAAIIKASEKIIVRDDIERYDLDRDPDEIRPQTIFVRPGNGGLDFGGPGPVHVPT